MPSFLTSMTVIVMLWSFVYSMNESKVYQEYTLHLTSELQCRKTIRVIMEEFSVHREYKFDYLGLQGIHVPSKVNVNMCKV